LIWLFLWLKQWGRALNQRTIKTIAGFVACAECEGKKVRRKINIAPKITNIRLTLVRFEDNPIVRPDSKQQWEVVCR
jgi:hypothetical protein